MNEENKTSQTEGRRRKLGKMIKLTFGESEVKKIYKVDDLLEFIPNGTTLGEMVSAFEEVGATIKFIARRNISKEGFPE